MNANDFHPLMYDRGRGPELRRIRITVYDLVPYLEHEDYRDEMMLELWPITVEELQVLKAFIAANRDEVMAKNREIDEWHERLRQKYDAKLPEDWKVNRLETLREQFMAEERQRFGDSLPDDPDRAKRLLAYCREHRRRTAMGATP